MNEQKKIKWRKNIFKSLKYFFFILPCFTFFLKFTCPLPLRTYIHKINGWVENIQHTHVNNFLFYKVMPKKKKQKKNKHDFLFHFFSTVQSNKKKYT